MEPSILVIAAVVFVASAVLVGSGWMALQSALLLGRAGLRALATRGIGVMPLDARLRDQRAGSVPPVPAVPGLRPGTDRAARVLVRYSVASAAIGALGCVAWLLLKVL